VKIACIAASKVPSRTANSIQVTKVCEAFSKLGHQVRLWVPGKAPVSSWADLASHYGLQDRFSISWFRSLRIMRRYDFCLRAVLAARFWEADLYYTWPLQAAAFASLLGLPTLLEVHDRPGGRFGPLLFRTYLAGKGAERLLPITNALKAELEMSYGRKLDEPFALISPMGVEIERYVDLPRPQAAREILGLSPRLTAAYTGHLYPGRGMDLLFELAVRNPEVQFVWVGGEEAAVRRWRERAEAEGVSNLRLVGFIPKGRVPTYQAAAEVLLMPYGRRVSTSSGGNTADVASPMKVFEYLATGRVIISSDLPVLREVLNSSNAILLPAEDVQAWDDALKDFVEKPEKWIGLARQAKQDAEAYSWGRRAQRSIQGLARSKGLP
jgi:glycosyltransferase involved in cell wall biosynthesis